MGRNDGIIERSWSSASVGSQGVLGGLVGVNYGTIAQSYEPGTVGGGSHARAGGWSATTTESCRNPTRRVRVAPFIRGPAGAAQTNQSSGVIDQSFAAGPVQGPPLGALYFGGIAANNTGTIATNVHWDKDTTTQTRSTGIGTQLPGSNGFTTAQMSTPSSFGPSETLAQPAHGRCRPGHASDLCVGNWSGKRCAKTPPFVTRRPDGVTWMKWRADWPK